MAARTPTQPLKRCLPASIACLISCDWFRLPALAPIDGAYDFGGVELPALLDGTVRPPYHVGYTAWVQRRPNKRCVRVREGGEVLQTIKLDYGCFACALGGCDGRTLFMMATVWRGPENMFAEPRTGQVVATEAPAPRAGWP